MPHGGPDVHWVDTARQLGSGIGMHLRTDFKDASLPKLYQIMASRRLHEFCEDAVAGGDPDNTARVDRFVENAKDNRESSGASSAPARQNLAFWETAPSQRA